MTTYGKLLAETLPSVIETDAENDRIVGIIAELGRKIKKSPDERKLMKLLVTLVENFEALAYPLPGSQLEPLEALEYLMNENGLRPVDMVDVFGSRGRVSEVLNGKRGISKVQAKRLGEKFGVEVGLFF